MVSVLDALPALICRLDTEGRYVFITRSNEKYFGPPEGMVERTLKEYLGADYAAIKGQVEAALRGESVEFEWTSPPLADGLVHQFLARLIPEFHPNGTVKGFITCAFNIDAVKQTERALRQSQEHLALALEAGQMGTWQVDLASQVLSGSPHLLAIHGLQDLPPDLSLAIDRIVHPEDKVELSRVVAESAKNHASFEHQYRIIRPDGAVRWVESRGKTKYGELGQPQALIGVVSDITERKLFLLEVERGESHFRQISDTLSLMIWISGTDGVIYWVNKWWYEYTKCGHLDWSGSSSPLHPTDIPEGYKRWVHSMATGEDFKVEMRFKRASDNTYRWHLVQALPLRNSAGSIEKWVGSSVEIHEQRSLVLELENEREVRERFVATLTHDLRNPMTAARMSAQLLFRSQDEPGITAKLTARIIESLDRTDEMIRNLLDANRITAGETLPIQVAECEINQIIREALDDLTTIYGNRFVFVEREQIRGHWDRAALRRVIDNLCGNAIKYGSPREITVSLHLSNDEVEIEMSVQNWGTPIPKEELETLFQYFRRRKTAQVAGQIGWGIGLTLVRGIAEAHGGEALVESSEKLGTIFKVRLPRDARVTKTLNRI